MFSINKRANFVSGAPFNFGFTATNGGPTSTTNITVSTSNLLATTAALTNIAVTANNTAILITEVVDVSLMGSLAQSNGTTVKGYGAELGLKVYKNVWLGLSYTKGSYSDLDLYSANASWTGWHARLNVKFDE